MTRFEEGLFAAPVTQQGNARGSGKRTSVTEHGDTYWWLLYRRGRWCVVYEKRRQDGGEDGDGVGSGSKDGGRVCRKQKEKASLD